MQVRIYITLKNGVLDPQGKSIQHALSALGFTGINDIRQGKYIEVDLEEENASKAQTLAKDMCDRLLANAVIEDYRIKINNG